MLQIKAITPDDTALWDAFVSLYTESFPECERRPVVSVERLARESGKFRVNAIEKEGSFAGFITCWDLGEFTYVEHFAIVPSMRSGGLGGEIIDATTANAGKTVILEAETATDEMSRRRLGFYVRHGFAICPQPYRQPAYTPQQSSLPMHILSYGRALDDSEFADIRDTIYETVYNTTVER